jgi:hypothetical protein
MSEEEYSSISSLILMRIESTVGTMENLSNKNKPFKAWMTLKAN